MSSRGSSGACDSMPRMTSGIRPVHDHPEHQGQLLARQPADALLAEALPLRGVMCAAASGRMCASSAARCSVIRATRSSQAVASDSRSSSPAAGAPGGDRGGHRRLRLGDAVVLALHPLHGRDDVGRHAGLQHRPEQPVLAHVVVVQQGAEQVEVVGDDGGAVGVAGCDAAHEGRRLAELAADRVVHHHHVAGVDAGGGGGGHAGVLSSEGRSSARISAVTQVDEQVGGPAERVQGGVRAAGGDEQPHGVGRGVDVPAVGERAAVGHGLDQAAEVRPPVLLGGGPQLGGRGVGGGGVLEGDEQAAGPHRDVASWPGRRPR